MKKIRSWHKSRNSIWYKEYDWEVLSKGENRRKACSIHLGGIYIECLLKGMLCSQCSVTAGTNQSQWIINGCEKAGRDGKNLGKHRTNNSK